jgi:hypothetical protein
MEIAAFFVREDSCKGGKAEAVHHAQASEA